MAETVTPSVRGTQRIRVVGLLLASGVVTGAGSAAVVALAWRGAGLPRASVPVAVALASVAVALDVAGRPRPLDVRRQVPQLWGRVFAPETAAVLYGARLGVGPLTILTSWLWWAAIAITVTLGPLAAALTGAAFHASRVVTMLAATTGAQTCMPARIASVQRRRRSVARITAAIAVGLALVVALTGCSDSDPSARPPSDSSRGTRPQRAGSAQRSLGVPAPTPETDALDALLPDDTLPGFTRVPDGERGAGPLDLAAAAAAERDAQAERSVLQTRGFRRGVARVWAGPDDDTVYVAVYEFADAAGASAYLEDGRELLEARKVREFPVDLPGAFGFTQVDETSTNAFVGHAVALTSGARYALVIVGGDGGRRTPDEARDVAAGVAARLSPPASSSTSATPTTGAPS